VREARKEIGELRKQNAELAREVARLKRMGENPPPLEMLGEWECTSYSAEGKEQKELSARGRLNVTLLTYRERLDKRTVIRSSCPFGQRMGASYSPTIRTSPRRAQVTTSP